ncbi:MAG: helix-turn-helix domain-containing protein [Candidatus Methylomirabilales bacterium]
MRSALEQEIGRRLRRLRKMRGLTQKALAAKIEGGIDYSYIGKIERGEQLPSLKVLRRIGEALNVPLGFFFQEEEPILLPEELRRIVKDEARMALFRQLSQVRRDDLPLLSEIIHVLELHRRGRGKKRRAASDVRWDQAQVAEADRPYGRAAAARRLREALEEIEKLLTETHPWPRAAGALEAVVYALKALKGLS